MFRRGAPSNFAGPGGGDGSGPYPSARHHNHNQLQPQAAVQPSPQYHHFPSGSPWPVANHQQQHFPQQHLQYSQQHVVGPPDETPHQHAQHRAQPYQDPAVSHNTGWAKTGGSYEALAAPPSFAPLPLYQQAAPAYMPPRPSALDERAGQFGHGSNPHQAVAAWLANTGPVHQFPVQQQQQQQHQVPAQHMSSHGGQRFHSTPSHAVMRPPPPGLTGMWPAQRNDHHHQQQQQQFQASASDVVQPPQQQQQQQQCPVHGNEPPQLAPAVYNPHQRHHEQPQRLAGNAAGFADVFDHDPGHEFDGQQPKRDQPAVPTGGAVSSNSRRSRKLDPRALAAMVGGVVAAPAHATAGAPPSSVKATPDAGGGIAAGLPHGRTFAGTATTTTTDFGSPIGRAYGGPLSASGGLATGASGAYGGGGLATGRGSTVGRPRVTPLVVAALIANKADEVGLATCCVNTLHIKLTTLADTPAYSKTLAHLATMELAEVVLPDTAATSRLAHALVDGVSSSGSAATGFVSVPRRFFNDTLGTSKLQELAPRPQQQQQQGGLGSAAFAAQQQAGDALAEIADPNHYLACAAAAALVARLEASQRFSLIPGTVRVQFVPLARHVQLDRGAIVALELMAAPRRIAGSAGGPSAVTSSAGLDSAAMGGPDAAASAPLTLADAIDNTCTRMGQRMLRANLLQPIADLPTLQGRFDAVAVLAGHPATCLLPLRAALSSFARHDLDHVLAVFARERATNDLGAARATLDAVLALRRILAGAADALRVLHCDPAVGVQLDSVDAVQDGDGGRKQLLSASATLLKAIATAIDGALSYDVGALGFDAFAVSAAETAPCDGVQHGDRQQQHNEPPPQRHSYEEYSAGDGFHFEASAPHQSQQDQQQQPRERHLAADDDGDHGCDKSPRPTTLQRMIDAVLDETMVDTAAGAGGGAKHVQLCFAVRAGVDPSLDDARRGYAHSVEQLIDYVDTLKRDHEVPSLRLAHGARHGYHLVLDATAANQLDRSVFTHVAPSGAKAATATTTTLRRMASDNDGFMGEVLLAQDATVDLVVTKVRDGMGRLHAASEALALLDVLLSHALLVANDASATGPNHVGQVPPLPPANEGFQGRPPPPPQQQGRPASSAGFVRPHMDVFAPLRIVDGRPLGIVYRDQASKVFSRRGVAQSVGLDGSRHTLALLTGPNGSGKTTLLRNIAHWALMAHIGCFVPAASATVPLLDGLLVIFAPQVDSSSTSASGFTQEMHSLSHVLRTARRRHLVLVDEIGRATSTSEGAAIAWAALERLADIRCPTVAATHFGPLTQLPDAIASIVNWHMEASPLPPRGLRFRFTVANGACDTRQYGIALAGMTGFPTELLDDARLLADGTAATATEVAGDQDSVRIAEHDPASVRPSADIPTTARSPPPFATSQSGGIGEDDVRVAAPTQRFPWGSAGVAEHGPRQPPQQQQEVAGSSMGQHERLVALSARGASSSSPLARAPDPNVLAAGNPHGDMGAAQLADAENVAPATPLGTCADVAQTSACRHPAGAELGASAARTTTFASVSVSATAPIEVFGSDSTADILEPLVDTNSVGGPEELNSEPCGDRLTPPSALTPARVGGSGTALPGYSPSVAPELSMVQELERADSDVPWAAE